MTSGATPEHDAYVRQGVLLGRLLATLDELEHLGVLAEPLSNAGQDAALVRYQAARGALARHFDAALDDARGTPIHPASGAQNERRKGPTAGRLYGVAGDPG